MRKAKRITPKELIFSFKVAVRGLWFVVRSQRHARIHLAATLAVCSAGAYYGITVTEWCWLVVVISGVWTAETLNTAFELLCDVSSPEFHPLVEKAKNVAAGAVLICVGSAGIIGLIIFIPYL